MNPVRTKHAEKRFQERGVSPLANHLLTDYGEEVYDKKGGILIFFSNQSKRNMERDFGKKYVSKNFTCFLDIYRVESVKDGQVITIGHRTKHIRRN